MFQCEMTKCGNIEMTEQERQNEFAFGWVGISMYDHICGNCFNKLKENN